MCSGQCLSRRIADHETLAREAGAMATRRNAARVAIDRQFIAADARVKLKHLYPGVKEQNLA